MMHNSLIIRDLLRETNNKLLHRSRRDPHRSIRSATKTAIPKGAPLRALSGDWQIICKDVSIPGMIEASEDLQDFLNKIGVSVHIDAQQSIVLAIDDSVVSGSFHRVVNDRGVEIKAQDMKGIWAAIVHLEKEITSSPSPSVQLGTIVKSPAWRVQISQSAFGANYLVPDLSDEFLSEDAFRLMAHSGINGMTLYGDWLCYVKSDTVPELNCPDYDRNIAILKEAAGRAAKYGIQFYYVPVSPKLTSNHPVFERLPSIRGARIHPGMSENSKHIHNLCSSDSLSLTFHGEVMSNLFREVPELGGLILIVGGESYYHCFMRPDMRGLQPEARTNCPSCRERKAEDIVNGLLKATVDAVHAVKPEAWVMAWPYSAFIWSSDPAQLELLEGMQEDVAFLTTIDKDQWMQKDGYQKHIWDYSVDYTGPAENIVNQAAILQRREMDLFVKTETAIGLETIHVPYVPSMQRLAEKWRQVALLKPVGVLQSWMFFGMWGSRAEELGWWTSWHPEKSIDEIIRIIACRDFGEEFEDAIIKAWSYMSEAVAHFPYISNYFTGPEFIGPAHPLFFGGENKPDGEFEASLYYLQENEETFSTVANDVKHSLVMESIPVHMFDWSIRLQRDETYMDLIIRERDIVVANSRAAFELIRSLVSKDPVIAATLKEELLICEFLHRTFVSVANAYKFLEAKRLAAFEAGCDYNEEMLRIATDELDNAKSSRAIYADAPWLDLSLRNDGNYPSSVQMLERKIELMEEALNQRRRV